MNVTTSQLPPENRSKIGKNEDISILLHKISPQLSPTNNRPVLRDIAATAIHSALVLNIDNSLCCPEIVRVEVFVVDMVVLWVKWISMILVDF